MFMCVENAFVDFNFTAFRGAATDNKETGAWQAIFREADLDGGGLLNTSEFESINWYRLNLTKGEFSSIDRDDSQSLDAEEWRYYNSNGAAVSSAQIDSASLDVQSLSLEEIETQQAECKAFLRKHQCPKVDSHDIVWGWLGVRTFLPSFCCPAFFVYASMYVCTHACTYVWMYGRIDGWTDRRMDGWTDAWMWVWMWVYMYVCVRMCTYVCIYAGLYSYVRMCVCAYACM